MLPHTPLGVICGIGQRIWPEANLRCCFKSTDTSTACFSRPGIYTNYWGRKRMLPVVHIILAYGQYRYTAPFLCGVEILN